MSILSDALYKKITFDQAWAEASAWFSTLLSKAPLAVQGDVAAGVTAFKQAASDAITLADTSLGPILGIGVTAVEAAVQTALTAAVGPVASAALTPAIDTGITSVTNALHAEIDAVAARFRASILNTPTGAPSGVTSIPASITPVTPPNPVSAVSPPSPASAAA